MNLDHEYIVKPIANPALNGWGRVEREQRSPLREYWWVPVYMAIAIGVAVWAVAIVSGLMAIL
jgi:hypothetical protein